MFDKNDMNDKNMDNLLSFAGKKMGCDPIELKKNIESGNFQNLNLPDAQKKQLGELLGDKEALNKILSNANVQKLLNSITKGR